MPSFTRSDELRGAEFVDADLRDARFVRSDLSGVTMRAVDVANADVEAPWLFEGETFLRVNGVDVVPSSTPSSTAGSPAARSGGPPIRRDCGRPGPRWSAPGRPPWSASRRCRPAPWTCR
ncbi:pentapeptide repeat-containing protein [Nocardioides mesophilus]|uniref:pentapeptide repeat-containing protein n=1 Tax=Nocardioides mesophilus TaxID=433659 RepID=UPI001FE327E7|nr:pentapeptide repeat-containing protein [Nocardioides mesophilus]